MKHRNTATDHECIPRRKQNVDDAGKVDEHFFIMWVWKMMDWRVGVEAAWFCFEASFLYVSVGAVPIASSLSVVFISWITP